LGIRKFENNKASQTLILLLSVDKSGFDFQKLAQHYIVNPYFPDPISKIKINLISFRINGTIDVHPLLFDFHLVLIYSPTIICRPRWRGTLLSNSRLY